MWLRRVLPAKKFLENAAAAEDLAENFERIMEATAAAGAGTAIKGRMPVLIVSRPLLGSLKAS